MSRTTTFLTMVLLVANASAFAQSDAGEAQTRDVRQRGVDPDWWKVPIRDRVGSAASYGPDATRSGPEGQRGWIWYWDQEQREADRRNPQIISVGRGAAEKRAGAPGVYVVWEEVDGKAVMRKLTRNPAEAKRAFEAIELVGGRPYRKEFEQWNEATIFVAEQFRRITMPELPWVDVEPIRSVPQTQPAGRVRIEFDDDAPKQPFAGTNTSPSTEQRLTGPQTSSSANRDSVTNEGQSKSAAVSGSRSYHLYTGQFSNTADLKGGGQGEIFATLEEARDSARKHMTTRSGSQPSYRIEDHTGKVIESRGLFRNIR